MRNVSSNIQPTMADLGYTPFRPRWLERRELEYQIQKPLMRITIRWALHHYEKGEPNEIP